MLESRELSFTLKISGNEVSREEGVGRYANASADTIFISLDEGCQDIGVGPRRLVINRNSGKFSYECIHQRGEDAFNTYYGAGQCAVSERKF